MHVYGCLNPAQGRSPLTRPLAALLAAARTAHCAMCSPHSRSPCNPHLANPATGCAGDLAATRLALERSRTAAVDAAATAAALAGSMGRQLRDTAEQLECSEAAAAGLDAAVKARQRELEGANAQIKVRAAAQAGAVIGDS